MCRQFAAFQKLDKNNRRKPGDRKHSSDSKRRQNSHDRDTKKVHWLIIISRFQTAHFCSICIIQWYVVFFYFLELQWIIRIFLFCKWHWKGISIDHMFYNSAIFNNPSRIVTMIKLSIDRIFYEKSISYRTFCIIITNTHFEDRSNLNETSTITNNKSIAD